MNVKVKFKPNSKFNNCNYPEIFENVTEVHYNYNNSGRIAIELEDTGYTYDIDEIKEFETY